MILIEPILLPTEYYQGRMSVDEHPFAAKAIRRTNFWHNRDEAMTYLRSRSLFRAWDDEILELYIHHGYDTGKKWGTSARLQSPEGSGSLYGGKAVRSWSLLPQSLLSGPSRRRREKRNGRLHRFSPNPIPYYGMQTSLGERRRSPHPYGNTPGNAPIIGEFFSPLSF